MNVKEWTLPLQTLLGWTIQEMSRLQEIFNGEPPRPSLPLSDRLKKEGIWIIRGLNQHVQCSPSLSIEYS